VARRNRVDPWGDLQAVPSRGLFTGNRGCLVDDERRLVRHHQGNLWITCLTEFRGWRNELDRPHRWTPLFFLDDAVALAAGHRPCGLCRRSAYQSYQAAVAAGSGAGSRVPAPELNRRLSAERLGRGRGIDRRQDRRLRPGDPAELPTGSVVADGGGRALLVVADAVRAFSFHGWGGPEPYPRGPVSVLTPATSVLALANGFVPVLHPSSELGCRLP
jgi:hypothetical protein